MGCLRVLISTVVLVALIKVLNDDDDVSFVAAFAVSLAASFITGLAVIGLASVIGYAAILVGVLLGAAALAVMIWAVFDVTIKRSFAIVGLYTIAQIVMGLAFFFLQQT